MTQLLDKPFSQACENNKLPILNVLRPLLGPAQSVLEIGSGTGQHAVFFAEALPHVVWQPSDQPSDQAGILAWIKDSALQNVRAPLTIDVRRYSWDEKKYDAVFSANSLHIMSEESAKHFVSHVVRALYPNGLFIIYGPFNYEGRFTSSSNARFDAWLKQQNIQSGIRDFESMDVCARSAGLRLEADHEMPANNRLLVWRKTVEGTR